MGDYTPRMDTINRGLVREVAKSLDNMDYTDGDTEELVETLVKYVVNGWWATCGGDLREWECLIVANRQRAVAWICSMVSMAHAIRTGQAEEWVARTSGV